MLKVVDYRLKLLVSQSGSLSDPFESFLLAIAGLVKFQNLVNDHCTSVLMLFEVRLTVYAVQRV